MVTGLVVAMVAVLLVLVNQVDDPGDDGTDQVADVSGAPTDPRDLPVLEVPTPTVTPEADAACPALMSTLPVQLAGQESRRVQSESPYAYAWGDPAVVLICGVPASVDFCADSFVINLNGVSWIVDTEDPDITIYTTVDRAVPVQMSVPTSLDSASVTALGPVIGVALDYVVPTPTC